MARETDLRELLYLPGKTGCCAAIIAGVVLIVVCSKELFEMVSQATQDTVHKAELS